MKSNKIQIAILIALQCLSFNAFAEWHTKLDYKTVKSIKDDYWSNYPKFVVQIPSTKSESIKRQEQLLLEGYTYTIQENKLIDIISVNYKNVDNPFIKTLKLAKLRSSFSKIEQQCPLIKSDKDVGLELLRLPSPGLLHSTNDETYLTNYYVRLQSLCNKTIDKNIAFFFNKYMGLNFNLSMKEANNPIKLEPYPHKIYEVTDIE